MAAGFAQASKPEPTVEELKAKIASAHVVDRPALCIRVSELQLGAAGRFYGMGDSGQAKAALGDVVSFSELARDYSIQSHKHEKQSEIAIRGMIRKLADLKHTVSHEEEADVQGAVDRMERVRDDLLTAMFPKAKGSK
ncbi:MAG: hypothetical protein ACLQLC_11530 [Candidatus Sulfotelmatobacter sp.]